MPTASSQDRSNDLSVLSPPKPSAQKSTRSKPKLARMDHEAYERRKRFQELLPAVIIALLVAAGVALMCWAIGQTNTTDF